MSPARPHSDRRADPRLALSHHCRRYRGCCASHNLHSRVRVMHLSDRSFAFTPLQTCAHYRCNGSLRHLGVSDGSSSTPDFGSDASSTVAVWWDREGRTLQTLPIRQALSGPKTRSDRKQSRTPGGVGGRVDGAPWRSRIFDEGSSLAGGVEGADAGDDGRPDRRRVRVRRSQDHATACTLVRT